MVFPERKGLTIYGAEWCPHCVKAKEDLAEHSPTFVDCTKNPHECDHMGIHGIPKIFNGEKSLGGWPMSGDKSNLLSQLGLA